MSGEHPEHESATGRQAGGVRMPSSPGLSRWSTSCLHSGF